MKKILIVFLCFLAGGLVYWAWPEYGSGYSEQQRLLWNERRAVYSVSWVLHKSVSTQRMGYPYSDVSDVAGRTRNDVALIDKEKNEEDTAIVLGLEENRDKSGPDYKVRDPLPVDIAQLPLYGLTEKEVAECALAGDGDACLKMVQNMFHEYSWMGATRLSWREKHEVEKWLDRAIALDRPGAVFLKTFFNEVRTFKKSMKGEGDINPGMKFDMEKTTGYADFVQCLKKGDYVLFKTASMMLPGEDLSRERKLIGDVLLTGAKQGRVENQRDFALLFFDEGMLRDRNFFPYSLMRAEAEKKEREWSNWMKGLPDSWKKKILFGLYNRGVIASERTSVMKKYREASLYARKAALLGDLTGMYLWVRYGITSMERYTVREWNDIFSYSRLLFESGYAPYLEKIKDNLQDSPEEAVLDNAILHFYYSRKSYESLEKKDYLASRNVVWDFSPHISLEEIRSRLQDVCLIGGTDLFLRYYLVGVDFSFGGLMAASSEDVRKYLLQEVDKWAAEGDLYAMYTLAGIYDKGIGVSADLGRAYDLYKKALAGMDEYPEWSSIIRNSNGASNSFPHKPLKDVIRLKMAEMVLNNPNFPGRDEKEVYEMVLDSSRDKEIADYCYPLLGLFHEKGIGRPVDRERALEFYTKGKSRSQACREALNRLTAEKKEANK